MSEEPLSMDLSSLNLGLGVITPDDVKPSEEWETYCHSNISDFHCAWHFLHDHPAFCDDWHDSHLSRILWTWVVKVDPDTNRVEDDETRNTKTQVWLEAGSWSTPRKYPGEFEADWVTDKDRKEGFPCHDILLDVGGDTYEDAIINLAYKVRDLYGTWAEYRAKLPIRHPDMEVGKGMCPDHPEASNYRSARAVKVEDSPRPGRQWTARWRIWCGAEDCDWEADGGEATYG